MNIAEALKSLILQALRGNALDIHDVDAGEEPFLYASGNWGPGYVMVKALVGWKDILKALVMGLAMKVVKEIPDLKFVAGNVSGGVVPGWILSECLEGLFRRPVPFVYIRDSRKKGGQKELITGIKDNPHIPLGSKGLVVEELVNFSDTTCNSAVALRSAGYNATHGACILFYENPKGIEALRNHEVKMINLFTLSDMLDVAEEHETHPLHLIKAYRNFLRDPLGWQAERGLKRVETGGTK